MPGDNSQDNQTQSTTQTDSTKANQSQGSQTQDDSKEKAIPYERFAEVNKKFRDAENELKTFRERDKAEADKKLAEEKKFQELIGNKDAELNTLKQELDQTKKGVKLESLKNKISNILAKNNVIDAEDGLKFVSYDDLLDSDTAEDEINKRVGELVKNKAYLFKAGQSSQTQTRSKTENNVPGNQSSSGQTNDRKKSMQESLIESLASKLKTT